MQSTDNDTLRQWLDAHPELKKMIAGHVGGKPTTATEMMYREREKMQVEEYRLYAENKKAEMQNLQQLTEAEYDTKHADRPCYNGLDQYTTSQLKAELRRRKGKKPLDQETKIL